MCVQTDTDIKGLLAEALPDLVALRRDLHQHPELMFEEIRTSGRVIEELNSIGIECTSDMGGVEPGTGTGVLAHLPATVDKPGPCVALRADMDALPIEEQSAKPYASQTPGVMHACGHDGHTAILLGAATVLSRMSVRPNPVTFIFQPAEEGGAGADKMIRDGALAGAQDGGLGEPVRRAFGAHGWPHLPLGVIATKPGPLLAATDEFFVTIHGTQAHAAYPHLSDDPIVAMGHIITALQSIASRRVSPTDAVVVTIGKANAGVATNVIPESATLGGTVRTLLPGTREMAERELRRLIEQTAAAHGCRGAVEWKVGYPATINDPVQAEQVLATARAAFGDEAAAEVPEPTLGGEDFAFYGRQVPSCFFFIGLCPPGVGLHDMPQLHQPKFDFNDEAVPIGVEMMVRLAIS